MKRAALLHCADIDLPRFKVLRQREQLPFVAGSFDEADSKQATYSLEHAFLLRLFLDLNGQGDDSAALTAKDACSVVVNAMSTVRRLNLPHPLNLAAPQDFWVGVIVFEELYEEEGECLRFTDRFAGKLADLHSYITDFEERSAIPARAVRTIIVNATRAARFVRTRADELDIPERFDLYDE